MPAKRAPAGAAALQRRVETAIAEIAAVMTLVRMQCGAAEADRIGRLSVEMVEEMWLSARLAAKREEEDRGPAA